jgi:predicted RNA-binding protein with PIN domain
LQFLHDNFSSLSLPLYIIFDGYSREEEDIDFHTVKNLHVIFTAKNQTADDYIIECVSSADFPSKITVVTKDKPLAAECRRLGACSLSIDKFLDFLHHKKTKTSQKNSFTEKAFEESPREIKRLVKIFEERLKELSD